MREFSLFFSQPPDRRCPIGPVEAVDVVEAQEKEMIEEVVAKIDKALEVIEEAKTSEERKDQT